MLLHLSLLTCLSLSFHVCLCLSSHVCLCLSSFIWLSLHMSPRSCGCACCCGVCASSCPSLKNAPLCTFKSLPCVRSERPCPTGHGRFERSHGSLSLLFSSRVSLLIRLSFSLSLSLIVSLSLSLSLVGSRSVLNHCDNEHSSSWHSLHTRL